LRRAVSRKTQHCISSIVSIVCRCQALSKSIQKAEDDPKIQALVLKSIYPQIFSAGLDLREMHNPDLDRLNAFWSSFQNLYFSLYGSRLACIAAIEGHAPAAGCMLALSCDYRIMAATDNPKKVATIGLNESKFGIVAPPWLAKQMVDTVGRRQAELSLSLGTLYTSEQAMEIGLVDAVVAREAVQAKAFEEAKKWAAMVPQARVASKELIRKERIDALRSNQKEDRDYFVGFITQEKVQENLGFYLDTLMKKSNR